GRSLNVVFDNADTESGAVWVDFNGDIVAKDVALYVEGPAGAAGEDANVLRFERLRVHTPDGWMFFARNLLDRRLDAADVGEIQLTFDGFDTKSGIEPTLGTLGPIGALSASPFESEGCMARANFAPGRAARSRRTRGDAHRPEYPGFLARAVRAPGNAGEGDQPAEVARGRDLHGVRALGRERPRLRRRAQCVLREAGR